MSGSAFQAGGDQPRQEIVGGRGGKSDLDRAGLAERDALGDQRRALGKAQDTPRLGENTASGRRQLHRAAGALKQLCIQMMLQDLDLPAERRLGHAKLGGGPAEMHLFGDRDETLELAELEHRCRSRIETGRSTLGSHIA